MQALAPAGTDIVVGPAPGAARRADRRAGDGRGPRPALDDDEWVAYRARVESAAVEASRRAGERP